MKQISYVYRAYPTNKQKEIIENNIGCTRYLHNIFRQKILKEIKNGNMNYSRINIMNYVKECITKKPFLADADRSSLVIKGNELLRAFNNHFNHPDKYGIPKFKKKKLHEKYQMINYNDYSQIGNDWILLSKIGRLKILKHRNPCPDYKLRSILIERYSNKKYYVNCIFEYDDSSSNCYKLDINKSVGLDFSIANFYVDSEGRIPEYPFKKLIKIDNRITKIQRKMKKMVSGSNNYKKLQEKVCLLRLDAKNIKNNAHNIIVNNLIKNYDCIFYETLKLQSIASKYNKNKDEPVRFGKRCAMIGYNDFIKVLNSKCEKNNKVAMCIYKEFQSSQICSKCGSINPLMKDFSIRTFKCPQCGYKIDRDENAAINIKRKGMSLAKNSSYIK